MGSTDKKDVQQRQDPETGDASLSIGGIENSITFIHSVHFQRASVVANTSVGYLSAVINGTVDVISAPWPEGVILVTNEGAKISITLSMLEPAQKWLETHGVSVIDSRTK